MLERLKSCSALVAGILMGVMLASFLRNGEINWSLTGKILIFSIIWYISLLLIRQGAKRVSTK